MVRIPATAEELGHFSQVVNGERPVIREPSNSFGVSRRAGGIDHRQWIADVGVKDFVEALEPPSTITVRSLGSAAAAANDFETLDDARRCRDAQNRDRGRQRVANVPQEIRVAHDDGR